MRLSTRIDFLDTAKTCVGGARAEDYGDLRKNFDTCASLWAVWIKSRFNVDVALDAEDVAVMNAMVKIARLGNNITYKDGWVDIAGYAALGGELAAEEGL